MAEEPPLEDDGTGHLLPLLVPGRHASEQTTVDTVLQDVHGPRRSATRSPPTPTRSTRRPDGRSTATPTCATASEALLRVENLGSEFPRRRGKVHAVTDVWLDIRKGETLGLVGESGCGKSTTGRAIMQLPPPTERARWSIYDGRTTSTSARGRGACARQLADAKLQMIFQDPSRR